MIEVNKNKNIADRLENLVVYISNCKVSTEKLRDSISDLRYAIAKLREESYNEK